jgi:hypothetical protein
MGKQMNKSVWIWVVILVTLIAVALLAGFWAVLTLYKQFGARHMPPPGTVSGDIELFYIAKTMVSTINIALLAFLIIIYADIYRKTRSEFTIGLLMFAIVFLMKDFASNPMVIGAFGFGLYGLGPFALLPDLFELLALSVLLYLSARY